MVRWAGGKTKKDHIKNEDIWREANIEPMTHKLHTIATRMLRWAGGKTKKDRIKNEDIWREANIEPMTTFPRKRRLRCYGHVLRKEGDDTTKKLLNMQVQRKRRRERYTKLAGQHQR